MTDFIDVVKPRLMLTGNEKSYLTSEEYSERCQACPLCVTNTLSMAPSLMFDRVLNTLLSLLINGVDTNKTRISIPKLQNLTELRISKKY